MKVQKNSRPAGTGTTADAKSTKTLHKHYNTKFRRMQAVFLAFIVTLVIIMLFGSKRSLVPIKHVVREGECPWTIAMQYKPDGISMMAYMDWYYEHNDGGLIYPGDIVIVGVYEND